MNLNEQRDEAFRIASEHGWHDTELSDEHWLMLVVSELCEAVEADRKNRHADRLAFERDTTRALRDLHLTGDSYKTYESSAFNNYVKDTVEDELSDVVIRCFDLAGLRQIDLPESLTPTQPMLERTREITFTEWAYRISAIVVNDFLATETKITLTILNVIAQANIMGFELWWHVSQKMHYNETRSFKHGKKY